MISEQQTPHEWEWFCNLIRPVKKYLEIGSYNGNSLLSIASSDLILRDGGVLRSIDLANHKTGPRLLEVCAGITEAGLDTQCLLADSHELSSQAWAGQWAPYDVVFIDGDHSYEGAAADWALYGRMGKLVCFHDIAGQPSTIGCKRLWEELKGCGYTTFEYIADQRFQSIPYGPQGIGVLVNGSPFTYSPQIKIEQDG